MTPNELLQAIKGAKVLESGANLTVPKSPRDGTLPRAVLHGWTKVEIAGQTIKFPENRNHTTIKRRLLRELDPNANLNAIRSAVLRDAFDEFIERVKESADNAAEKRKLAEGPQIEAKILKLTSARKEREKKEAYRNGIQQLERLFQGALFEMDEDELLEVFRLNRVEHVMES